MSPVAVVLSADTESGAALCRDLAQRGWTVYGGNAAAAVGVRVISLDRCSIASLQSAAEQVERESGIVDMLVANPPAASPAAPTGDLDFALLRQTYDTNALGVLRFVSAFLPLMEKGRKRLCFVTDAVGLLEEPVVADDPGSAMATAALHMECKILFNDLHRDGYTFRLFLAGSADAEAACDYFLKDRADEDRLVIVDAHGKEWPF